MPQARYLNLPCSQGWEVAPGRYFMLFTEFGIRLLDVSLRLPCRRLYIGSHVQEYLAGLDAAWEEHLTMRTRGVKNALERGNALSFFPIEGAAPPDEMETVLGRAPATKGRLEQGSAAPDATASRQNEGGRFALPARQSGTPPTRAVAATTTLGLEGLRLVTREGGGVCPTRQARPAIKIWKGGKRGQCGERGRREYEA